MATKVIRSCRPGPDSFLGYLKKIVFTKFTDHQVDPKEETTEDVRNIVAGNAEKRDFTCFFARLSAGVTRLRRRRTHESTKLASIHFRLRSRSSQ